MSAPDPTYVRMFNNRREWTLNATKQQAAALVQDTETLRLDLEKSRKVSASQAHRLADAAALLAERLAALEAFDEVSFLATDPDAPEVPR